MDDSEITKKKSKKDKRHKNVDVVEEIVLNDEDTKEERKLKKKRKREKELEENPEPICNDDNVDEDQITTAQRKEEKKLKKQQKIAMLENSDSGKCLIVQSLGNYIQHSDVDKITKSEMEAFRQEAGIVVYPEEESYNYHHIASFEHIYPSIDEFCPHIKKYIVEKKFSKPSPIQVFAYKYK